MRTGKCRGGVSAARCATPVLTVGHDLARVIAAFPDLVQLNLSVTSRDDYATARQGFGEVWKRYCQRHYPAMAMFMVAGLFDPLAVIEIQGIAAR